MTRLRSRRPEVSMGRSFGGWEWSGLAYGDGERFEPGDAGFDDVAPDHRRDAGGRAGEDEVAGKQFDLVRQQVDDLRNLPEHVTDIRALADFAVHLEFDPAACDGPGIEL